MKRRFWGWVGRMVIRAIVTYERRNGTGWRHHQSDGGSDA